jgi:Tfp pilus assembly protein PilF
MAASSLWIGCCAVWRIVLFVLLPGMQDPVTRPVHDDLESARTALAAADFATASELFQRCLARERTYDAVLGAAQCDYHLRRYDEAEPLLAEARLLRPAAAEPWTYLALTKESVGRDLLARSQSAAARDALRAAAAAYDAAAERAADPFDVLYWGAECRLAFGDAPGALERIERAAALRPGQTAPLLLRCRALKEAGRWAELARAAAGLRAADAANAELLALELEGLARSGEPAAAIDLLKSARRIPEIEQRFEPLAAVFDAVSKTPAAEAFAQALEDELRERPDAGLPRFYLGLLETHAKRFDAAAEHYRRYLDSAPQDALVQARYLFCLRMAAKPVAAEAALADALRDAGAADLILGEGQALVFEHVKASRFARALELQRLMREFAPENPRVLRGYAVLLKENGQLEEALVQGQALLALPGLTAEQMATYGNDLALCLKGLGRLDECELVLRRAIAASAADLDSRENLGVLLFDRGEWQAALASLREVTAVDGNRLRSLYHIRQCERALRRAGG